MKDIFIVLMDTASEFQQEINILIVTTSIDKALHVYRENVIKAKELASEMGYTIEESKQEARFTSFKEEMSGTNHYNVALIRKPFFDQEKTSVGDKLKESLEMLKSIPHSGYWPYSSPAPCSTETAIKRNLNEAIIALEKTFFLHKEMFGKNKADPMGPPSVKIEKVQ